MANEGFLTYSEATGWGFVPDVAGEPLPEDYMPGVSAAPVQGQYYTGGGAGTGAEAVAMAGAGYDPTDFGWTKTPGPAQQVPLLLTAPAPAATLLSTAPRANGHASAADLARLGLNGAGVSAIPAGAEVGDMPIGGTGGEPNALPALLAALAIAGPITLGLLKTLLARFGPTLLKLALGSAAFAGFMKLLEGDSDDGKVVRSASGRWYTGRKKRYSIGSNPRVGTLAKVARHAHRLIKRHQKVLREFEPRPRTRTVYAPPAALSAIERRQLKAGGV